MPITTGIRLKNILWLLKLIFSQFWIRRKNHNRYNFTKVNWNFCGLKFDKRNQRNWDDIWVGVAWQIKRFGGGAKVINSSGNPNWWANKLWFKNVNKRRGQQKLKGSVALNKDEKFVLLLKSFLTFLLN